MTTPSPTRSVLKTSRWITDGARDAGRSTVALLRDSGFATIGATDAAVAYVRKLGERAEQVRVELPDLSTLRNRDELSASLRELSNTVEARFGALAGRGREVVDSLQRSRPSRDAAGRARMARSQVETAATNVAQAGEAVSDAAQQGAAAASDIADVGDAAVDYESLTVGQLRDLAREHGIAGRAHMNKSQLVTALRLRTAT